MDIQLKQGNITASRSRPGHRQPLPGRDRSRAARRARWIGRWAARSAT